MDILHFILIFHLFFHTTSGNWISDYLLQNIDAYRIKQSVERLTKEPHVAGTSANQRVAQTVQQLWNDAGLEDIHTISYEVPLSYPDYSRPNRVIISSSTGQVLFNSTGISPPILSGEQDDKVAGHQWLAWSAPGTVTADVVFANRGSYQDFEYLKNMGIDGKIAIMRYGGTFRATKVLQAQLHGAVGAILYSDPYEVAAEGINKVYPKKVWMPAEGVQGGSLMTVYGDPTSPLYPSIKGMYPSKTIDEAKKTGILPQVPVLPVSYTTAYQIFKRIQGKVAPTDWEGSLNVTYRLGPGFLSQEKLTIEVHSSIETRNISNVIGYIRGSLDEDRYVILGNHYDAWNYGALDPNSGTAVLSEIARAMVETIKNTNWKPARSIMFIAWDAEEFGLLGSNEFVEEFSELLSKRAVVYLNMDCIKGNTTINVRTIPSLYKVTTEVAKRIPNPNKKELSYGRPTLYDSWVRYFPSKTWPRPDIKIPGGGSDMAAFLNYIGVPVVDFQFLNATTRDSYPLYHSLYDTIYLSEKLLDTDEFSIHKATGQYWAELARSLADENVLPINSTDLAAMMLNEYLPQLKNVLDTLTQSAAQPAKDQYVELLKVSQNFYKASTNFEKLFTQASTQNSYNKINERIMSVDRCFINPRGLSSPQSRHVLFSVSSKNAYSSSVMAGVYDAIYDYQIATTIAEQLQKGRNLAFQMTIVQHSFRCAISTLKDRI